ncbi:MAG TPA: hypothetical protein DF383_12350, partial [Deltaproteobacteria bacterium]|nr:hypothetical protein [Deltaproteobacteria bacterium]
KKTFSLTGVLGSMMGAISDLLNPLADFSLYFTIVSMAVVIALAVLFLVKKTLRSKILAPMLVAFFCAIASTCFYLSQSSSPEAEAKGVLAANIPGIQSLQESLGIIGKNVAEIKETTHRIEGKTDQILISIEKIGQKFETLSKQGAIIDNPKQPEEFYNNARIYELRGDYGNARRAYLDYFKFDLNLLDPHLRFIKFLKV